MNSQNNFFENLNERIKNSVSLKLFTITILMLLLLIPAAMIESIIHEREKLNKEVREEVSSKWARQQQINGPLLSIPLIYEEEKDGKTITTHKYWNILPENLIVEAEVMPRTLKRGIYEVVVYSSEISCQGDFDLKERPEQENLKEVLYHQAFFTIGISDLRGIKNQIKFICNQNTVNAIPGSKLSDFVYSGLTFPISSLKADEIKIPFSFTLDLQGSQNLSFIPLGTTTQVNMRSPWSSPSFMGNFLPDQRTIDQEGFEASWMVLQLNRNYPQSWIGAAPKMQIEDSAFGVDFILPLDDYQKSSRSAKYAVMSIALTFLLFFLVEILNKRKIHPLQYALVGLAICLFYILLVSISEHLSFNMAYGISVLAIVAMITLYSLSVFKKLKLSLVLLLTLSALYGFLFVTLQLSDYALLLGSIGLVLILACTMYFTRNVNWYTLQVNKNVKMY